MESKEKTWSLKILFWDSSKLIRKTTKEISFILLQFLRRLKLPLLQFLKCFGSPLNLHSKKLTNL